MNASDIMTCPVQVVDPKETIAHVRNLMLKHKISRCLVLDGNKLTGIITKKDIARRLCQNEPKWRRRPIDMISVEDVMRGDIIAITPETGVREIASIMIDKKISSLPVLENGSVIGIVSKSDFMNSKEVARLSTDMADLIMPVETVSRYHSLDHVMDILDENNGIVIVVNNNGSLAGVITESNVALFPYKNYRDELLRRDVKFLRKDESAGRKQYRCVIEVSAIAEDLMSRPVVTVTSDSSISDVIGKMLENHIGSVIVVDDGEIKGFIERDNIIQEVAK
ncbi:MAG: CBS domain-containing protein [Methanogenium sp.]|nr:CBS domain-containing protein [Methanogenium sp.]